MIQEVHVTVERELAENIVDILQAEANHPEEKHSTEQCMIEAAVIIEEHIPRVGDGHVCLTLREGLATQLESILRGEVQDAAEQHSTEKQMERFADRLDQAAA